MRAFLSCAIVLEMAVTALAESYLVTLSQKVRVCTVMAHVEIASAVYVPREEPPSDDLIPVDIDGDYVVVTCRPVEVFKGKTSASISFRVHAYSQFEPKELSKLIRGEYVIFLHDPLQDGVLWLFEGPKGMQPIAGPFEEEWVDSSRKLVTDVYERSEYLSLLRNWERVSDKKAAQPGATDNPDDAQRLREDH